MNLGNPAYLMSGPRVVSPSASIPFRESAAVSAPEAGWVLIVALLLLAAFYGIAWHAKKAGWLERWTGRRPADASRKLAVLERLAVSRKTVLFRVRDGEKEYLLVESSSSVQIVEQGKRA